MIKVSRRDNCDRYYLFKLFGFGIFLHRIHTSEDPGVYHNHPWNWFSIIFGWYYEEKPKRPLTPTWLFNCGKAKDHHRIEVFKPVWTLFFHGRRCNEWTVVDEQVEVLATKPWEGIGGQTSYLGKLTLMGHQKKILAELRIPLSDKPEATFEIPYEKLSD